MSRDFTLKLYYQLLESLQKQAFHFLPYCEFNASSYTRSICLRHDVDMRPMNSFEFAKIEHDFGIRGTYYFRAKPESFDHVVVSNILKLGHEIGYHYEDLAVTKNSKKAIESFERNLERLRELAPVTTICMHGSPLSKYDSRMLWKDYNYADYGIVAEPYFDIDFSRVLYLTDTGRRWNGNRVAVRDKLIMMPGKHDAEQQLKLHEDIFNDWNVIPQVNSALNMTTAATDFQNQFTFHSTMDIITAAEKDILPDKIILTLHPQRWTDQSIPWLKELIFQNIKNVVKYFFIKMGRK